MKKITMQDIADKLNISKNSVSQALSNKSGVSEATRQLVMQTASDLGYKYKTQSKEKVSNQKYIGLIASNFAFSQENFFGEIFLNIENQCKKNGYALLTQSISDYDKENMKLPYFIDQNMIDGLIIVSHISDEYIRNLLARNIPAILVDHHSPLIECDAVLTNNRLASYKLTEHLINKGHKRIGFIGDIHFSPSYYERLEGYKEALDFFNLSIEESFIIDKISEKESDVFNKLERLKTHPTAWVCVNDGLSYFTLSYYQKNKYKVPNDIAISSFDNGYLSKISIPRITTVDINLEFYAKKAIDQLISRIQDNSDPFIEILLPTKLIVREST